MQRLTLRRLGLLSALALAWASPALAADPAKEPTPAQRQKMAEVHQRMADCLRSTRPLSACRSEMMTACHDMVGAGTCPMMGKGQGGMGPGMMGEGMPGELGSPPPQKPKK